MSQTQQAMAAPFQTIGNIPAPAEPVYSVDEDIQDLAMEIYARLAFDHIKTNPDHFDHQLSDLAKRSHTAALAYFETLGATIDGGQPNGQ